MEKLNYSIEIDAPARRVWDIMLGPQTYTKWCNSFSEGSYYEGKWDLGAQIRFLCPGSGGTLAVIEDIVPYEHVLARHIAIINANGSEERHGPAADSWVGTTEKYVLKESGGKTTLFIEIITAREYVDMFNSGWPQALQDLKNIVENE